MIRYCRCASSARVSVFTKKNASVFLSLRTRGHGYSAYMFSRRLLATEHKEEGGELDDGKLAAHDRTMNGGGVAKKIWHGQSAFRLQLDTCVLQTSTRCGDNSRPGRMKGFDSRFTNRSAHILFEFEDDLLAVDAHLKNAQKAGTRKSIHRSAFLADLPGARVFEAYGRTSSLPGHPRA